MKTLLVLCALLLAGCSVEQNASNELPPGVTKVKGLSFEWAMFEWRGKKYLYGHNGLGNTSRSVMVEISEEQYGMGIAGE